MNSKIKKLLKKECGNYIFPFFWQRGEDESVLREYMEKIHEANVGAVCVESRPHPDFCGPQWWHDLDIILDEAEKRKMQVWILDDSHFPTGFANGAIKQMPDEFCRQSLCYRMYSAHNGQELYIPAEELKHPEPFAPSEAEQILGITFDRIFEDDQTVGAWACRMGASGQEIRDLSGFVDETGLHWNVDEGEWRVYALMLSRNQGYHRDYINMMDGRSCRVLIDQVYEPHYNRYKDKFGTVIAGFFSDEPEMGNGHIYPNANILGTAQDLPWSQELEQALRLSPAINYPEDLIYLWDNDLDQGKTASVRYAYMDEVTRLVRKDFSEQIGSWCRERGVRYIGHIVEDNNQHARLGSSLGHYFRSMQGQDMAGIDDIVAQVYPQGEDDNQDGSRNAEFYHYMLGTLASSAAAIEPLKKGNSMCEIFGNYGWSEGVQLEKYLTDHFLCKGVNHFVPHAFSAAPFPDPDCPPHFYAHGNNPQYRHFGKLMEYTNRVCELLTDGKHVAPVAVMYHGEAEWGGKCMFSHQVGRVLTDAQINYDYIPQDVFDNGHGYPTAIEDACLRVNTQQYRVVIIPYMQFVTKHFAEGICRMMDQGVRILFVGGYPAGICTVNENDQDGAKYTAAFLEKIQTAPVIDVQEAAERVRQLGIQELAAIPADKYIHFYHYEHDDGMGVYFIINEGADTYKGKLRIDDDRFGYCYDAWCNTLVRAEFEDGYLSLELEPKKSYILIMEKEQLASVGYAVKFGGGCAKQQFFLKEWKRSFCRSIDYPLFGASKVVKLPDSMAEENPQFSGFVRYENSFVAEQGKRYILEIEDASEGVEVFVGGESLGIQIVPRYIYELTEKMHAGFNEVVIEVATTLERELASAPRKYGFRGEEPQSKSGITGKVTLHVLS